MVEKYNIEELIIRFLKQEISEDELRYLETWLAENEEHKSQFFELKNVSDLFDHSIVSSNNADWQKMYDRIERIHEKVPSHIESPMGDSVWLSVLKYAAIAILALGLGWGVGSFYSTPVVHEENVFALNEIHVPKGGRINTVVLSDGTKVILNAGTTFKYPNLFNEKNRKVYLDGEAYFDVVTNKEKPFIVKLNRQEIKVLGTTFNVQAYSEDSCSLVTLLSGQVSLETFNEMGEKADHALLAPNQSALTDNRKGSISLINVDPSLVNAWIKGIYKFKDEPLSTIVKRLENYYNIHIHLGNSQLGQIRYTGTFSLDQDILDVFRIIDHEKQFVFTRTGNDLYIKSK